MNILYIVAAFIIGGAGIAWAYESYFERKEAKIGRLLAPKLEKLIEVSSREIAIKQGELKRDLTEDEKNKILDECYNEI